MIYFVIGTRAQLIKTAPVMIELNNRGIDHRFVFTGQHTATIDDIIELFKIKHPDFRLYNGREITRIGQAFLWSFKCILKSFSLRKNPDKQNVALVHGDAYSTMLAVIIAKLLKMRIGHIEAGLRSFDCFNPFPEEITRVLTSKLVDFHFCPGRWALSNVKNEPGTKVNTGVNTLYDTLKLFAKNENEVSIDIPKNRYALISIHRFENVFSKERMKHIVNLVNNISKRVHLVFVLHPVTEHSLRSCKLMETLARNDSIEFRERCDYFRFIKLMVNSEFIITDGGSNQEESYYLGKPCLLFRDRTERLEGLGRNVVLSQFDENVINNFVDNYRQHEYPLVSVDKNPSRIIVDFLEKCESK
jgi:UDP-N-acetylglucosamine 2-epimerase (non-hydrolysing)